MGYQFAVASSSQTGQVVLTAPEFRGGRLDWYSFSLGGDPLVEDTLAPVQVNQATVLPNHVTFKGMPNPRWWNFEDGQTDYGGLETGPTDLTKMLLTEFAVVYGNDWFEVPIRLQVGTINRVRQLLITDTFGERTLSKPANAPASGGKPAWSMFAIAGGAKRSDLPV